MDAGELCGSGPTGVTATASIEAIVDLGADCVLYTPSFLDVDELCRRMPGAPEADGGRVAGLHGQPRRQRRALCLRGPAGNPFDT